jgi:nitrite reductase/ring-hydroxylating ferredoxin subunit
MTMDSSTCSDCPAQADDTAASRRDFIKCIGATMSIAAFGFGEGDAVALPVMFGDAVSAAGAERQYPIPIADAVNIDHKNQIIVVRYQNHLYAFSLACPHEHVALKWLPKDDRFQCPKHDSMYKPTGVFIGGRATRNMDRFGVHVENEMLVVDVSKLYESNKDPAGWAAATVALG